MNPITSNTNPNAVYIRLSRDNIISHYRKLANPLKYAANVSTLKLSKFSRRACYIHFE
jgi:hypothetical protein